MRPVPALSFDRLFLGELLSVNALPQSRALGDWARAIVEKEFGAEPEALTSERQRESLDRARPRVAQEEGRSLAVACLRELGVPARGLRMDSVRLRAVSPGLENIPAAAPAFYAHRDTWYGNPKAQINGWLPLVDVTPANSFRFYLDDFARPVRNDSETFEAARFESRGGFGRTTADAESAYPRALALGDGSVHDIDLPADSLLFFSAAHLHQTLPNRTTKIRFSLDFRFVRDSDLRAQRGAPDPDNRSRGSVVGSYHRCF